MSEFIPQTELGKRLLKLRQQAIAKGMELKTTDEIEAELDGKDYTPEPIGIKLMMRSLSSAITWITLFSIIGMISSAIGVVAFVVWVMVNIWSFFV